MPIPMTGLKRPIQFGLCVASVVGVISLFVPNYYKSEARLLPVETKGGLGSLGGMASAAAALGINVGGLDNNDGNFVDILQSRWLLENLLGTEFRFRMKTWRFGPEKEHLETLYHFLDAKNMDMGIRKLDPILHAVKDPKSKVILISAESRSPGLSQEIVQTSVRLLETFQQEKSRTRGGAKAIFAGERLADARVEMSKAEDALRNFLQVNRGYQMSSDPSVRLLGARLEAELKLRMQLVMTLAISREQALMDEKNDVPILNVMDDGNLPYEKSGPGRALIAIMTFIFAAGGFWAYKRRSWIWAKLVGVE